MQAIKSTYSKPRYSKKPNRYEQAGSHIYCPKCSYHCHYKKSTTMSMHYINQHAEKRFWCTECNVGYGSRCNYLQHMQNAHCEERYFQCPCCPVRTKTKGNLLSHYGKEHVNDAEKKRMMEYFTGGDYMCVDCKKVCKKSMINYHVAFCSPTSSLSKSHHRTDDALGAWIKSLDAEKKELDVIDALIAIVEE